MAKTYNVWIDQVNQQYVTVEATSPSIAKRKATKLWRRINQNPDIVAIEKVDAPPTTKEEKG